MASRQTMDIDEAKDLVKLIDSEFGEDATLHRESHDPKRVWGITFKVYTPMHNILMGKLSDFAEEHALTVKAAPIWDQESGRAINAIWIHPFRIEGVNNNK